MQFILITDSPEVARFATLCGIDRIMVDLEVLGKAERQGHLDTVMNSHGIDDVRRVREIVGTGQLIARTNPLHAGSASELDAVIAAGADHVMLPFFHGPSEVGEYIELVAGRAQIILLVETAGAMEHLAACANMDRVNQIHIGLNDLSLQLGKPFMFELMADGTVEGMAAILREARKPFGIGGVARVGEGLLPAEVILAEHARLGSTAAILSRTFHRQAKSVAEIQADMDFAHEVQELRRAYFSTDLNDKEAMARNSRLIADVTAGVSATLSKRGLTQQ